MKSGVLTWFAVGLVLLVPTALANAWATQGSEAQPHVTDERGNVRQINEWPGAGLAPRPHMDVLAAWLEYQPNGKVQATIKLDNLSEMYYASDSWDLYYTIEAGLFDGDRQVCWMDVCYRFVLQASKIHNTEEFRWNAWYAWPENLGVAEPLKRTEPLYREDIPVTGTVHAGIPGYVRFWFDPADVAKYGDRLEGFHVESREYSFLGPAPSGWQVFNEASSEARFALTGWTDKKTPISPAPSSTEKDSGSAGKPAHPLTTVGAEPPFVFRGDSVTPVIATVQIGSLAGILGLLALVRFRLALLAAAALFTRIAVHDALDHPRRALLLELVQRNPGAGFVQLRQLANMGSGPLAHHLAVLERHGLVRRVLAQGRRVYFPPHARTSGEALLASRSQVVEHVVRAAQGASARQIAKETGLTRTGALYHLRRLESQGQVRSEKRKRTRWFFPS